MPQADKTVAARLDAVQRAAERAQFSGPILLRDSGTINHTYLLRLVLKVTTRLGRSIDRRSVLMVPTSSRAKSNMTDVFG